MRNALIFLFLINIFGFSQKKNAVDSKPSFEVFYQKAKDNFQKGNYERAYFLFRYCSDFNHPLASEARNQKRNCIDILGNIETSKTFIAKGNVFEVEKIFYQTKKLHPEISKNAFLALVSPTVKAPSNIPKVDDKVKTKPSQYQIAQNSPKEIGLNKKVLQTTLEISKENLTEIKRKSDNSFINVKQIPKGPSASDIINIEAKQKKLNLTQVEFEKFYILGFKSYSNCDFVNAFKYFTNAARLRPNAPKTKKLKNESEILKNTIAEIQELTFKDQKYFYNDICSNYDKILRITNACSSIKKEYYSFVKSKLERNQNFSCTEKRNIIDKLNQIFPDLSKTDILVLETERLCLLEIKGNEDCKSQLAKFKSEITIIDKSLKNGYFDLVKEKLTDVEIEMGKLDCKDVVYDEITQKINELKNNVSGQVAKKNCNEIQSNLINTSLTLSDNNCLESFQILQKVDTSCLSPIQMKLYEKSLKNARFCFRTQKMKTLEDSASRSGRLGFKIDEKLLNLEREKLLLEEAMENAESKDDSSRIASKLRINKCAYENNGTCNEKPKNLQSSNCVDTTKSFIGKNIFVSFDLNNTQDRTVSTRLYSNMKAYITKPGISIGFSREKIIFKRDIHFGFATYSTVKKIVSPIITASNTTQSLIFSNISISPFLKLNSRQDCPFEPKLYFKFGGNFSYNKVLFNKIDSPITNFNKLSPGFNLSIGLDTFNKMWKNLEISYHSYGKLGRLYEFDFTSNYFSLKYGLGIDKIKKISKKE